MDHADKFLGKAFSQAVNLRATYLKSLVCTSYDMMSQLTFKRHDLHSFRQFSGNVLKQTLKQNLLNLSKTAYFLYIDEVFFFSKIKTILFTDISLATDSLQIAQLQIKLTVLDFLAKMCMQSTFESYLRKCNMFNEILCKN